MQTVHMKCLSDEITSKKLKYQKNTEKFPQLFDIRSKNINTRKMCVKILLYLLIKVHQSMARDAAFVVSLDTIERFDSGLVKKELLELNSLRRISLNYLERNWCDAVWLHPNKIDTLTNLVISGGFEDTKSGQKVVCYTKRQRVIYPTPQATISSSPLDVKYPKRTSANLEDGVYGFDIEECFHATVSTGKKHFLIGYCPNRKWYRMWK